MYGMRYDNLKIVVKYLNTLHILERMKFKVLLTKAKERKLVYRVVYILTNNFKIGRLQNSQRCQKSKFLIYFSHIFLLFL